MKVKCIEKIRDKTGVIVGYTMQSIDGSIKDFDAIYVKEKIKTGEWDVVNLTLTSNNKLVDSTRGDKLNDSTPAKQDVSKSSDIMTILRNEKAAGSGITVVDTCCKHKCYVVNKGDWDTLLLIPDDVSEINERDPWDIRAESRLKFLTGNVKVIGGAGLKSAHRMFWYCKKIISLDLSEMNTSNVEDMSGMFLSCRASAINMSNLDTSNVRDMNDMFRCTRIKDIDLSSFDTHKVRNMAHMFEECTALKVNVNTFNTENIEDMRDMFKNCRIQLINLSSFKINPSIANIYGMFSNSEMRTKITDEYIMKEYHNR